MKKPFRSKILVTLCVFLSLTLVACSKSDEPTTTNETTTVATIAETETTTTTTVTETETTAESLSTTRKVTTEKGEVEIPASPQRIADLSGVSDILYILGNKPVATADSDAYDYTKFPTYLEKELSGAKIVGYPMSDSVDIEGVLQSAPDLIIMNPRQEKAYDQLSKIATTIVINPNVNDWRSDMRMVASLLGKSDAAEAYITQYNEKVKAAGEAIKAANGNDTTYFSFLTAGSDFYLFTGAAYGDIFYNDMGLKAPAKLPEQDNISLPVATLEGLTEIDSDYMVVLASDDDKAALEANPVWQSMRAVKNGHIIWLPQSPYFNQAYSTYGKNSLVDELQQLLTK